MNIFTQMLYSAFTTLGIVASHITSWATLMTLLLVLYGARHVTTKHAERRR